MKLRTLTVLVLVSGAISLPAFAQANRNLTPVQSNELNRFIGMSLKGRYLAPIGIVSEADRQQGTIRIVGRHGEVATIPTMALGRYGLQLRAPAISSADVARASFTGKSRVPLTGEVTVAEAVE